MRSLARRRFFEDSFMAAAAISLPAPLFAVDSKPVSANEKITAAIIGCGIRGKAHANDWRGSPTAMWPMCAILIWTARMKWRISW